MFSIWKEPEANFFSSLFFFFFLIFLSPGDQESEQRPSASGTLRDSLLPPLSFCFLGHDLRHSGFSCIPPAPCAVSVSAHGLNRFHSQFKPSKWIRVGWPTCWSRSLWAIHQFEGRILLLFPGSAWISMSLFLLRVLGLRLPRCLRVPTVSLPFLDPFLHDLFLYFSSLVVFFLIVVKRPLFIINNRCLK